MKYSIPLLATVRIFVEEVKADFTVMPRLLICSHSASIYLRPLRIGLSENWEGLLLIDNGFYSHLTEDLIYDTNKVLVELMASAELN